MPSNTPNNKVKHKINGYNIEYSNSINKWVVKLNNKTELEATFKECKTYAKKNGVS